MKTSFFLTASLLAALALVMPVHAGTGDLCGGGVDTGVEWDGRCVNRSAVGGCGTAHVDVLGQCYAKEQLVCTGGEQLVLFGGCLAQLGSPVDSSCSDGSLGVFFEGQDIFCTSALGTSCSDGTPGLVLDGTEALCLGFVGTDCPDSGVGVTYQGNPVYCTPEGGENPSAGLCGTGAFVANSEGQGYCVRRSGNNVCAFEFNPDDETLLLCVVPDP